MQMDIKRNHSLKPFNTFGVDVLTDYFVEVKSLNECKEALKWAKENHQKILLLGGGSNMLLVENWKGLAVKINTKGIEVYAEEENSVFVRAQAGENWHEFVMWTLNQDFGGIENLSLIPGNVGTVPIQNIGAYGVEIKNTLIELDAIHIDSQEIKTFSREECRFGYRESIFKNEVKDEFIILSVSFKLSKKNHELHINYGDIQSELQKLDIQNPTIQDVSRVIIKIRESKLPDPEKIGNSGSFFKNPVISISKYEEVKSNYPEIIAYPVGSEMKVAAGWLIERAGWKGKRVGQAGVHEKQALVLVNYGGASGKEIYDLSEKIIQDIQTKFGITLEREVNIIQS